MRTSLPLHVRSQRHPTSIPRRVGAGPLISTGSMDKACVASSGSTSRASPQAVRRSAAQARRRAMFFMHPVRATAANGSAATLDRRLSTGNVKRIHRSKAERLELDPSTLVSLLDTGPQRRGARDRGHPGPLGVVGRETDLVVHPLAGHPVDAAGVQARQDQNDRLRFEADALLALVVERPVQAADVKSTVEAPSPRPAVICRRRASIRVARMGPLRLALLLSLGVPLASTSARADAPEAEAEAQAHFESGQKLFTDGDYRAAVKQFLAAYQQKPHPDVLINIATSYERMYKPNEARDNYERFLRDAPQASPLRPLAVNRLRVLRALPGSILVDANKPGAAVHLTGEGHDLTGVTPKRFEELPPGVYKVHVALGYHTPADIEVRLDPGAQDVVNLTLEHEVETLTIFSRPDGARVFLDDREEGVTPFSRPVAVGKRRRLRVEAVDFPAHHEELDVIRGQKIRRDLVFKRPFRSGRSELVLGAMFYGGLGSVGIAEAAGGPRLDSVLRLALDVGVAAVGVGLGFLVSLLTTSDEIKVGHSSIIIGGGAWGTTLGASLAFGLKLSDQNTIAVALLGGGLGLGSGIVTARLNDTSPGDAAVVNSGGLWGSMTGLLLARAIGFGDQQDMLTGWLTFGGCGLGVVAGAFLAWGLEVSRGHVAVVDAFAISGLALAFGVGFGMGTASHTSLETGSRYGLGGMTVGLLTGAILSRRYKDDLPPTDALLTHHNGRFAVGLPQLRLGVALAPEGRDARLTIDLARGEF
ncbi:MAG: PEGA domain-containing protein [Myxococcales bacterium]|nr:PEGA domain-containing protein [Myxococcales bacterium]